MRVVLLGGPTASGKSRMARELASRYPAEIVNADSRQIYRHLSIGTDQPSIEEQQQTPHHLFGFLPPESGFTAVDYERAARPLIEQIQERGKLPIVIGGTGFYFKALLKGSWPAPAKNENLQIRLKKIQQKKGRAFLHRMLRRIDAIAAEGIAVNDVYRVVRALEIFFQSGRKPSQFKQPREDRFAAIKMYVAPDRSKLKSQITERTEQMFNRGWVDEVRQLLLRFPEFEGMPAASSLGYAEIIRHLRGTLDLETCKKEIVRKTRQYAKRQLTWFRNQDQFLPVQSTGEMYKIVESVLELG